MDEQNPEKVENNATPRGRYLTNWDSEHLEEMASPESKEEGRSPKEASQNEGEVPNQVGSSRRSFSLVPIAIFIILYLALLALVGVYLRKYPNFIFYL